MASARTLSLVVASEQQDNLVTVGVAKHAQQDLGRLARLGLRRLPFPRQELARVLVESELEDPAADRLAEVRADDVRTFVLEDLLERDADRTTFRLCQLAQPTDHGLVAVLVLVELECVGRLHGVATPRMQSALALSCAACPSSPPTLASSSVAR